MERGKEARESEEGEGQKKEEGSFDECGDEQRREEHEEEATAAIDELGSLLCYSVKLRLWICICSFTCLIISLLLTR